MRPLWTLFKVIVGLAIAIPVVLLAFAMTLGVVGAVVGLAMQAIRLAVVLLAGYGVYRLARALFGSPRKLKAQEVRNLPPPDPYYDSALRELDAELRGTTPR